MSADRTIKDKAMAARMKGSGSQNKIASNGVDKFVCRPDAEFRTSMQCPMCHSAIAVTGLDAHLRGHMGGADSKTKAA